MTSLLPPYAPESPTPRCTYANPYLVPAPKCNRFATHGPLCKMHHIKEVRWCLEDLSITLERAKVHALRALDVMFPLPGRTKQNPNLEVLQEAADAVRTAQAAYDAQFAVVLGLR